MNKKERIIEELSKELTQKKETRINIRVSHELYEKLVKYKKTSGANISDIIRIALMNYFIENEVNN